jgi:metallophosphoesterase (TIGR00282 family)
MKILMCGDVMARSGRDVVAEHLPHLRESLGLDFVLVNGENAAGGFGITGEICRAFYQQGADAVTLGNHAWDQRETAAYIEGDGKLIRPANYPPGTPGRGSAVFTLADGRKVLVIQVMCRLFMDAIDDPFASLEAALAAHRLGATVDAILVDIHGEASSEKQALARLVDGRVSLAAGTHTHVPTADHMILPRGTAFITDIGMCGAYNSIIGMEIESIIERFVRKMPGKRWEPVADEGTLAAVYVETDDATGLATRIEPIRAGGVLSQASVGLAD